MSASLEEKLRASQLETTLTNKKVRELLNRLAEADKKQLALNGEIEKLQKLLAEQRKKSDELAQELRIVNEDLKDANLENEDLHKKFDELRAVLDIAKELNEARSWNNTIAEM